MTRWRWEKMDAGRYRIHVNGTTAEVYLLGNLKWAWRAWRRGWAAHSDRDFGAWDLGKLACSRFLRWMGRRR